ncbi:uncharacterized protein LOC135163509 isoform X1 [Diachasmimorpha longicaudata]|uniref:uncharacterized protein LOC135163509 isoform X1 n=2 Tax=Diachasmimorpha longicaudata TaxID=58733 RepID=UPI0030B8FD75
MFLFFFGSILHFFLNFMSLFFCLEYVSFFAVRLHSFWWCSFFVFNSFIRFLKCRPQGGRGHTSAQPTSACGGMTERARSSNARTSSALRVLHARAKAGLTEDDQEPYMGGEQRTGGVGPHTPRMKCVRATRREPWMPEGEDEQPFALYDVEDARSTTWRMLRVIFSKQPPQLDLTEEEDWTLEHWN